MVEHIDMFINSFPKVPSEWLGDMVLALKKKNHQDFQKEREELQDAYEGNNLQELTDNFFKNKENKVQTSVPGASQNLIERAIRRRSLVYKNRPDYGVAKWPEGYDAMKRWLFFKSAERIANNIGTILLRAKVIDDEMNYELLTDYIPFFEEDPLVPTGILYPVTTPSADITANPETQWVFWTKDILLVMDSKGNPKVQPDNTENVNRFGILPFVTVNVREGRDYWRWGYGKPLLDANLAVNVAVTEMRLGTRYSMMGQWVATGQGLDDIKIKMGVDQVIKLPQEATLQAIAPPAEMSAAVDYAKFEYENVLQNMGLNVQWGDDGGVPSGESLKVKNIELLELREDDVATWQVADEQLYEVEQAVWEGKLPNRTVNYDEIEFPVTPTEQQAQDQWDLDHGLLTTAQILMRDNPDGYKTEKKAQDQINKNREVQRASAPPRVPALSAIRDAATQGR
ncbi:hypothetical protein LCGC14_1268440 [marine sediment metagenome]|uniref:Portal protein n=1 Tax=marine sediment metagenome TaxID=412755 RepID=A0A0F9P1Y4_9ZZZZ|nr:hypothetical protein [Desulfobacterales bacterium]